MISLRMVSNVVKKFKNFYCPVGSMYSDYSGAGEVIYNEEVDVSVHGSN